MKKALLTLAIAAFSLISASEARALPINVAVPTNAYITIGSQDWAWAAPCAPVAPSCGEIDLSYQGLLGWRLPTVAEYLAAGIDAFDFVVAGANVDFGTGNNFDEVSGAYLGCADPGDTLGGDVAIASPYFSTAHSHADWCDVDPNSQNHPPIWAVDNPDVDYADALVVRDVVPEVPEPGTVGLVALGLFGLVTKVRKMKKG